MLFAIAIPFSSHDSYEAMRVTIGFVYAFVHQKHTLFNASIGVLCVDVQCVGSLSN